MHPGMADTAEGEQVFRVVVGGVAVEMVDMKVIAPTADDALLPVPLEDHVTDLFPSPQAVFLLRPDLDCEPFAVDAAWGPHGKRTLAAEPAKAVLVGTVTAERGAGTVERVQAQLKVGAHYRKTIGCKTR